MASLHEGRSGRLARFGINADTVLTAMMRGGAEVNILVLDGCRPNQVAANLRPVAGIGLAEIDARDKDPERSVLVAYSTGLGEAAADGDDKNSPYACQPDAAARPAARDPVSQCPPGDGQRWPSKTLGEQRNAQRLHLPRRASRIDPGASAAD